MTAIRICKQNSQEIDVRNSYKICFWIDSKIDLKYIKNEIKCFSDFATHLVTQFREHSKICNWNYTTSKFKVVLWPRLLT